MERKRSKRYRNRRKSTWTKIKDFIREVIAFMFSNVGIIGLVVGYTICGAVMFQKIEGGDTNVERRIAGRTIKAARKATAQKLWEAYMEFPFVETKEQWKNLTLSHLKDYQEKLLEAVGNGYDGGESSDSQWSFSGAFLYSLTVITTIGYGNVAPRTDWGKVATIFYAIIGMPLFLLYLSNIGDILAKCFKWSYSRCCLCKGCGVDDDKRRSLTPENSVGVQFPEINTSDFPEINTSDFPEIPQQEEESSIGEEDEVITVPVTLCLTIMVGYICGGAYLFMLWEGWNFLDSSYFCFISLSTIGFGDLVPGDQIYSTNNEIQISFIFCSMYLMLGMATIAMCFNLMQEEVIHKFRTCAKAIKNCFTCGGNKEDDDGPQIPE